MHKARKHSNGPLSTNAKRKYNKKPKHAVVAVNFCPNCGCNLHAVAVGLAMSLK